MDKINFYDETTGEYVALEIIDQLTLDDTQYMLVADEEDEAYIFKVVEDDGEEITYAVIEDDLELQRVTLHFMESDEYDIEV